MKRFILLFLLSAGVCLAENATLPRNTVMRTGNSLVILKAGTVVQILEHGEKTVSIKVNGTTGTIPWSSLDADEPMQLAPHPAPAAATVTAAATPPAGTPAEPHKATTMYGKAVEKARAAADSHEKAMVNPTDEILGGK
jgi:hypothetical protein